MDSARYGQVKEIFTRACELPDDARGEFLGQQCGDDAELRQEAESLLRYHSPRELVTTVLGNVATDPGATDPGATSVWESRPLRVRVGHAMLSLISERGEKWRRWGLALLATGGMIGVGWWLYLGVRNSLREMRAHEMKLVLAADIAALRSHFRSERLRVQSWVQSPEFRQLVAELTAVDPLAEDAAARWRAAPARRRIEEYLRGVAGENVRFAMWNRTLSTMLDCTAIPGTASDAVGTSASESGAGVLTRVFAGETVVRTPHRDELFQGPSPIAKNDRPVMSIVVPIHAPVNASEAAAARRRRLPIRP